MILVIPHASEKYNGVYMCLVNQGKYAIPSKIIIEVISLVVKNTKPTKKVRLGKNMTVKSNGLSLSYVYADLSQWWELNGTVWKEYGVGGLELVLTN